MNCPKCGYTNAGGTECPRCGIIFTRFRSEIGDEATSAPPGADTPPERMSPFRRFYRVFRWIALAGLILVLYLLFRPSSPPRVVATPEAARRAELKIVEFQSSLRQGFNGRLAMDEDELNGWLHKNLALQRPESAASPPGQESETPMDTGSQYEGELLSDSAGMDKIRSSVRDVKIELLEDAVRVYAQFDLHGVDMSLELEGRPVVRNGYLRLDPSGGKLGSLPLMAGTLQSAADRIFEAPQNREKFRLPPEIEDVRVEQGRLIVISR